MTYLFKQAAHLQGKDYLRGLRDVPPAVERDPYFHKLVANGLVVEPDAAKVQSVETPQQRQEKLLKRLLGDKAPKTAKDPEATAEMAAPAMSEEEELAKLEEDEKADKELGAAKAKGAEVSKKKHAPHHSKR